MAQTIEFPCGSRLELTDVTDGLYGPGGPVAELELLDGPNPGLWWMNDYDDWDQAKGVRLMVERRTLRPLIQWLTLLEQELR